MTGLIIAAAIAIAVVVGAILAYNSIVGLRNKVDEAWAQISVQLKRRHDLIPPLVSSVKGYATHEKLTLESVIQARNSAMGVESGPGSAAAAGQAEEALSGALNKMFALSESYPDLKANTNFLQLQDELVDSENRIAFSRQYYNDSVRQWNTRIQTIPFNLFAGAMKAQKAEYFEIQDIAGAKYAEAISPEDTSKPPSIEF